MSDPRKLEWKTWPPVDRLLATARKTALFGPGPIWCARAPGRLDVMGGIADYTGSLVCEMPLGIAAAALVQPRQDGKVLCRSMQTGRTVELPADFIHESDPVRVGQQLQDDDAWARYVLGCWWMLCRKFPGHDQAPSNALTQAGVTILIDSDVPLGGGVSSSAAIEVAAMSALATMLGAEIDPLRLAVACQSVENRVVGAPCGVMDQVTAALGRQGGMLEILCQAGHDGLPAQVLGSVPVPNGYGFVGIHSGVRHDVSGDPYTDTRVAAFIAQRILEVDHDLRPLGHHLANIDADLYRENYREKLPESLTGAAFLQQYGHTNDPVTAVRPETAYHVRAGCDHHVFEADRVRRFVDLLKRAATHHDQAPTLVQQAGELMYQSHESYGLNAKMGHQGTDLLVDAARTLGPRAGFFGAKITGGGCGGTVALLIAQSADVMDRVEMLCNEYTQKTGRPTMLFVGSGPGCAELGAHAIPYENLP